jgi:adenylate cyclase
MNRKIAAIFAADVAGYSKLVAEDEEETLRRLASYRAVMDDFIQRAGGRIFNTAGDAVLAEFSSAVEAVRCAIDIQESLRTRNLAYPASRAMSFRIGITIGDVVERNGDLLGDGVNIAARLEGIAPIGGICISRAVHEQVANKLSVQFADIGEQQVKNIPTPVHAYKFDLRPDDSRGDAAAKKKPGARPAWVLPLAIGAPLTAIAIAAVAYLIMARPGAPPMVNQPSGQPVVAATPPNAAPSAAPSAAPNVASSAAPSAPQTVAAPAQPSAPPQPVVRQAEALVPEAIPFIPDRSRATIRNEYMTAADHKALAITAGAPIGFISGQPDDDTAKSVALDMCQKHADASPYHSRCEIYAVGNTVVYAGARPPLPPTPWVKRDPATVRPVVADDVPIVRPPGRSAIAKNYVEGKPPKALIVGPKGGFFFMTSQESTDEAVRRGLELCGNVAGIPCLTVAVNDEFVVAVPSTMRGVAYFQPANAPGVAPDARDDLARRLANASGWTAVAAGVNGHAGVAVGAANEQAATGAAMADCAKQDSGCRVIAIGPFVVEPEMALGPRH